MRWFVMRDRDRFEAERTLRRTACVAALLVGILGLLVLSGYALGIASFVTVLPGLRGMSPLTALGLIALSTAVAADGAGRWNAAKAAGMLAASLGLGLLAIHATQGADTASPLVAQGLFRFDAGPPGLTSPATAGCLAALGLAALVRTRPRLADGLGSATLIVAGMAVLGYAYGVQDLYATRIFGTMALHTALALVTLAGASMLVRPDRGAAAIIAADQTGATRRQLIFSLLPPLAGWVLLDASRANRIGPAAAMALLVAATVLPLVYLILRDGATQITLDAAKRAEATIAEASAADMERRLREQATALERVAAERVQVEATAARAQRMEAIGQLTGGIAHDFNNLLMAISGNLELSFRRLPEDHPARRYVNNAAAAAERGAKVTTQLLAFSRRQRLDTRPVEIDPALARVSELLGPSLGPTVDIAFNLAAPGLWALTDPDQLELAILNLAVNARDAMEGTGKLSIDSRVGRMRVEAGGSDIDCVVIRVVDNGRGMTPDVAARAIEPFFTTKERGKGTGLGLAQVYGFARQCGGDLRIVSAVGEGTTIEIVLPQTAPGTPAAQPAPATPPVEPPMPASRERPLVLVVDDDDQVRSTLVEALGDAGFAVAEARNGPEGLAKLDTIVPAAAVIDFIMPGMNGAEVARRARVRRPGLPIVFVSGYFDTVALEGIAGAVILRKPFNVAGLRKSLASVVA